VRFSQQSHHINCEHIPLKDRYIPVSSSVQLTWELSLQDRSALLRYPVRFSHNLTRYRRTYSSKGQICSRFVVGPTDVTIVSPKRPLSPAEITHEIFTQSHTLNGEHIPLKNRYLPVFAFSTQLTWPLSPAEINRLPDTRIRSSRYVTHRKLCGPTSAPSRSTEQ
jgi:hypothetical protein